MARRPDPTVSSAAAVQRAVEQLRQRHGHLGEQLENELVRILEHPDDTLDGDRQVLAELKALARRLDGGGW